MATTGAGRSPCRDKAAAASVSPSFTTAHAAAAGRFVEDDVILPGVISCHPDLAVQIGDDLGRRVGGPIWTLETPSRCFFIVSAVALRHARYLLMPSRAVDVELCDDLDAAQRRVEDRILELLDRA